MTGKKYSDGSITDGVTANNTDRWPVLRSGTNVWITPAYLATLIGAGSSFIGAQAMLASTQSISDNTQTAISFDTQNFDTDTMYETVTHPTRMTIVTTGKFDVKYWGYFASNSTGYRYAAIYSGGSVLIAVDSKAAVNGTITGLNVAATLDLVAGDYLEIKVFQNSGGALTVTGVFDVHKIG